MAPDMWPAALEAVATAPDAGKAVMFGIDLRAGRVSDLRTHNIDSDATDRFAAYYHRRDPWLQGFQPEWRAREPIPGTRIISEIAAHQDIAVDTARKRLKAVFEKTRTHRQAELVQRVLSDFGEL